MNTAVGIVSKLCPSDLDGMLGIELLSNPLAWSREALHTEFSNPCARIIGIRASGALRGFIIAHFVACEAHIVSFAVHPDWRRKGLGKALLIELIGRLKSEICNYVTLEVRVTNYAAIKLYESVGFYNVGIRANYYKDNAEDALTLRLNVA